MLWATATVTNKRCLPVSPLPLLLLPQCRCSLALQLPAAGFCLHRNQRGNQRYPGAEDLLMKNFMANTMANTARLLSSMALVTEESIETR
jgi:hypothetical protein